MSNVLIHPKLSQWKAYVKHRDNCEECNMGHPPLVVGDLCETGRNLWCMWRYSRPWYEKSS